jgi:hypothetical protein
MFRLKLARLCAIVAAGCTLTVTAVALSGGPREALLLFGLGGALIGLGGWRAGKLEA